ncbi:amino acid adenylation domain-containing protein [Actinomadura rupiterrae]|nr:amino acid adenylation domain-containing protein [Actinomadura rupiterrae]
MLFQITERSSAKAYPPRWPGLEALPVPSPATSVRFDIELHLDCRGESTEVELTYSTDLFDRETAIRLARHYVTILKSLPSTPRAPVATLSLLSADDQAELLSLGAGPVVECPDRTLSELFEEQVGRTPGAVAVVAGDESLTYAELNARANKLARRLGAVAPVGPGAVVAVCLPRTTAAVISVLAVLKSGSGYLPLDPDYPAARLTHMLEESRAVALITHTDSAPPLTAGLPSPPTLLLDQQQDLTDGLAEHNLASGATSRDLAYVIYTSGSTGRPKGVMIEHRNIVNLVHWHANSSDHIGRVLQYAPFTFDVSVQEIFLTLLNGGMLHLVDNAARTNPSRLADIVSDAKPTTLFLPPAAFSSYLAGDDFASALREIRPEVVCAGEQLQMPSESALITWQVHNQYGPTETHVATHYTLPRGLVGAAPIGRPVANARVVLMSENDQLVPRGSVGEIWIGGAGVGRGYLGQPDLTAERFVADPFGGPGDRLYRTGDLGRWLPDGNLEFVGRVDHQIKLRGHRIEPGEIEACLRSHPDVVDALVTADQDGHGAQRLIAYLRGGHTSVEEVRQYLARYVPAYMVPTHFVTLDDFPLTANGKVDRGRLPEPEETRPELQTGYIPPRDPTEAIIAGIWEDILGLDRIGVHDNFLHLGGHSLKAVAIISRIRKKIDTDVTVKELFRAQTVARLTEEIRRREGIT